MPLNLYVVACKLWQMAIILFLSHKEVDPAVLLKIIYAQSPASEERTSPPHPNKLCVVGQP